MFFSHNGKSIQHVGIFLDQDHFSHAPRPGGVSPTKDNLEAWFNAGVTCVGMGSKLITKDSNGDFMLN